MNVFNFNNISTYVKSSFQKDFERADKFMLYLLFFHWMAASGSLLKFIDVINIFGLILIGAALFIGLFTRIAAIAGTFLLSLYYFAYPPFGTSLFSILI